MKLQLLLISFVTVLLFVGNALGHGSEKHESTTTTEAELLVDSLSVQPYAVKDSIFAVIQSEFETLAPIFKKGCFDCHTSKTDYPWYYNLPLVKSLIDDDIEEARRHLDMSQGFPFGGHGKPADDLVAIIEEIDEGEMPLFIYRLMHWSAKPSDSERDSINAWVKRGLESLESIDMFPAVSDD